MIVGKWNPKTKLYEPYKFLPGLKPSLYEDDMNTIVSCARCGMDIRFGDGYTSRQIHSVYGLGYAVCEACHYEEMQEEKASE